MVTEVVTAWELIRGEPATRLFRFHAEEIGNPLDLTDRTYRVHLRPYAASDIHTAALVTVTDPTGGAMTVTLTAEQTDAIPWNIGVWSLEETIAGVAGSLIEGDVIVRPDVTR